jgi:imidazoleglycerol-phosphate dehydratase
MLELLTKHARFDLAVKATGDLDVDEHHTVEDVGICLGKALAEALGDKAGIVRFANASVPMDEALARVSVDLSGRAYYLSEGKLNPDDVAEDFLQALAANGLINLHVEVPHGRNSHHIQEAVFKAVAVALRQAVALGGTPGDVPSTKGVL